MATRAGARQRSGLEDFLAIPDHLRFHEVLGGKLTRKAMPSGEHGAAQGKLRELIGPFDHRPGGRPPGGWWLATEVEILLGADELYRPDVLGWRRDRAPERPRGSPVRIRPDWVCEVVSPSSAGNDRVKKLNQYHRFGVPHYWIVDPSDETLVVFRWTDSGYLAVLAAASGDEVRAEPFDAVAIRVSELFGHDSDETPEAATEGTVE